jgi:hypothetical protein
MYIFKNFPGEKFPTQGRPRLTRGGMGDGGEGKGKGKRTGERARAGNLQNLYAAYAHGETDVRSGVRSDFVSEKSNMLDFSSRTGQKVGQCSHGRTVRPCEQGINFRVEQLNVNIEIY